MANDRNPYINIGLETLVGGNIFNGKRLFEEIDCMDTIDVANADGKITLLDSGGISFFGDACFSNDVPMNLMSFGQCRS